MRIQMIATTWGGLAGGATRRFVRDRVYAVPKDLPEETAAGFLEMGAAVALEDKARAAAPRNKAGAPAVAPGATFQSPAKVAGSDSGNSSVRPVLSARGPRAGKNGAT